MVTKGKNKDSFLDKDKFMSEILIYYQIQNAISSNYCFRVIDKDIS